MEYGVVEIERVQKPTRPALVHIGAPTLVHRDARRADRDHIDVGRALRREDREPEIAGEVAHPSAGCILDHPTPGGKSARARTERDYGAPHAAAIGEQLVHEAKSIIERSVDQISIPSPFDSTSGNTDTIEKLE